MNKLRINKFYQGIIFLCLTIGASTYARNNNLVRKNVKIDSVISQDAPDIQDVQIDEQVNRGLFGGSCGGCGTCACCLKNIQTIKKVPTTISTSGVYCLNENLFATSCDQISALVTISSSDVMINLNGFTLTGGRRGIQINPNLQNIMIQNGAIINSDLEAVYVSPGVKIVQLTDLQIINANQSKCGLGIGGVVFAGLDNNRISDSLIKNVAVTDTVGRGFSLEFTDNTKIVDSSALSILNTTNTSGMGFLIIGDNNLLENNKAAHILTTVTNLSSYGFLIAGSVGTIIKNSQASFISTIAPAGDALGFSVEACGCTLLEHCVSQDNSALPAAAMPVTASNAVGFRSISSTETRFFDCVACHNNSTAAGIGHGFVLGGTLLAQADLRDCISECVSLSNTGDGFRVFSTCANCVTRFSKALANTGFGFNLTAASPTNIFYSNFAAQNVAGNYNNIANVNLLGAAVFAEGDNINGV